MKFKRALAIIISVIMVFSCMPVNTVYAEGMPIDTVYIVATTNNELPTGVDDPDILKNKPALNSQIYLWVMTSAVNELVGADVRVNYNPNFLNVVDMDTVNTGVQPVLIPTAPAANEVSIFELPALNAVEAIGSNNVVKYAAANESPSNFTQGAVLLKAKFVVKADIMSGLYFSVDGLELRGKLGLDNNPIIITPGNVKPFHLAFDATAKVEALEAAVAADLTVSANIYAAETAVSTANTAIALVPSGTVMAGLQTRVAAAQAIISNAKSATTAVSALQSAALKDLTILSNLTDAEAKVTSATTAIGTLVGGSATKTTLQTRFNTASSKVTTARTTYNAANGETTATTKVVALETAAAANLTILSNLTAAEAAVTEATTAVNALATGTTKTALLARVNTAAAIVTAARTAYNAANTPPTTPPTTTEPTTPTPPPVVVPTPPTTDTGVTQGANTVSDAASGTQPINDTTPINDAINQAVKSLTSSNENTQTANISVVTTQIIANAGDIATKVSDTIQKETFITTTINAISSVVTAASTVSTEANAIDLANSFKTISQEITTLANITTSAATQQQLAVQQEKLADTMQTVVENVIAGTGTVRAATTNMYGTVTVSLNQQAITDLLAKADAVVAAANKLDAAIASSGIDANVEKKIVLEVVASTGVKTVNAELPSTVLEQMQAKGIETVEIESGVAKITVAPDFITKAANTQTVALEVQKVALTTDLINSMNEQQKALVQSVGEIYDFNAILKDSSNTETKVTNFNSNIEISLPYSLKPGENKDNITVLYLADDGTVKNMAGIYDEITGTVTFMTNHFSKYLIKNNVVKFSDVTEGNWAKKEIEAMASKGIVSGNQGKYLPANNITRAEFAKLIATALNIVDGNAATNLKDVSKDAWYYEYVASAVKAGIISGKSDGTFAPNETISRQDMAIMLSNAMTKVKGEASASSAEGYISSFVDKDRIAGYAVDEVATAIKHELMAGKLGNKVDPSGKVTKAEAAAVIYRLFNK